MKSKYYSSTYSVNSITLTGIIDVEPKMMYSKSEKEILFFAIHFNEYKNITKNSCPQSIFVWCYDKQLIDIMQKAKKSDCVYVIGSLKKFKRKDKTMDFCIVAYHVELQQKIKQSNVNIPAAAMLDIEVVDEDESLLNEN